MLSKTKAKMDQRSQSHVNDFTIIQISKSENFHEQTLDDMIKAIKEKYPKFNGNQNFLYILARGIDDKSKKINIILIGSYIHYITFGLQIDNTIRLVGQAENIVLIDSNQNNTDVLFIAEPQFLVSPTTLQSFDYCARKALLLDNFRPFQQGTSACMFQGNIIHQLFQTIAEVNHNQLYHHLEQMKSHQNDPNYQPPEQYVQILQDIYKDNIKEAFYLKLTLQQTIQNTLRQGIETLEWVNTYFKQQKPLQIQFDYQQKGFNKQIKIKQLKRIEEDLHSPLLGFLGKPDLVIEVEVLSQNGAIEYFTAPLELKTGKANDNHIKQVIVYAKMINDKRKVPIPYGFLLYLQALGSPFIKLIEIDKAQFSFNELIFSRNKYVLQQKKSNESVEYMNLPKIDDMNYRACDNCDMQNICTAVCKVYDKQEPDTNRFEWYLEKETILKETSIKYLNNMLSLIRLEEATQFKDKDLDLTVFKITKRYGDFVIQISKSGLTEQESQDLADKFMPQDKLQLCSRSTDLQIRVTVQQVQIKGQKQFQIDDNDVSEYSLSQGNYEVFKVNVKLRTDFQVFDNVFKFEWTIRQYQQLSNYKSAKTAITQLIMDPQYSRKKDILVLGHNPRFTEHLEDDMDKLLVSEIIQNKIKDINDDQKAALIKCIKAEDFAVILGYPGTGKSTLVAHLLYVLFFLKQKVLVCGYTNNSVNLIIDKFIQYYSNFEENCLRFTKDKNVGFNSQFNQDKINFAYNNFNNSVEIQEYLSQKKIYFTTCLSQTDPIVSSEFDYCIVDEASQVTEPQTIQNIMCSKKFILVGDYQQLTPIVKSSKAKVMLQVSLLERLAKQFPQAVCHLTYQYRMNEQIMKLANFLVYDGKLRLPNNEIARARLEFDVPQTKSDALKTLLGSGCIQFFDCPTEDHELRSVIQILKWMNKYKLQDFYKVVITTYNKQARKLEQQLKGQSILTIDKSQGLDCDCIILVCSQNPKAQNHLLSNIRRINVALTRAKKKLIIVGNYQYLQNITNMSKLLNLLQKQGCIVTLDNEFLDIKD